MSQQSIEEALPRAELDAPLRSFYQRDPRRARSAERDLGLHWRDRDGASYPAAWVEATGELYSVRHGTGDASDRLTVIATIGIDSLERELAGWREVCERDEPGSYEWLRERAVTAEAATRRRPGRRGTPLEGAGKPRARFLSTVLPSGA